MFLGQFCVPQDFEALYKQQLIKFPRTPKELFPNIIFVYLADSLTDREFQGFSWLEGKLWAKTKNLSSIYCDYKHTIYSPDCFNLPGLSGLWIMLLKWKFLLSVSQQYLTFFPFFFLPFFLFLSLSLSLLLFLPYFLFLLLPPFFFPSSFFSSFLPFLIFEKIPKLWNSSDIKS